MNILIRLPNWLGDMVMSTAFVQVVKNHFPDATVDLIAKKGIDFLLDYFPAHEQRFIFSKEEYKGITGARKFGKMIRKQKNTTCSFHFLIHFLQQSWAMPLLQKKGLALKKNYGLFF